MKLSPLQDGVGFQVVGGDFLQAAGAMNENVIQMPVRHGTSPTGQVIAIAAGFLSLATGPGALILIPLIYGMYCGMAGVEGLAYKTAHVRETKLSDEQRATRGGAVSGAVVGGALLGGAGMITGAIIGKGQQGIVHASLTFPDGKAALVKLPAETYARMVFAMTRARDVHEGREDAFREKGISQRPA